MTTTPNWQSFIKPPNTFQIGGDLDVFLKETRRFFELSQISEEMRILFVKAFLDSEAVQIYENATGNTYEEKLKKLLSRRKI